MLQQKILQALEHRALATDELLNHLDPKPSDQDLQFALYELREQKKWIDKHPIIGGGCKDCACQITYKWRLTFAGRRELANHVQTG